MASSVRHCARGLHFEHPTFGAATASSNKSSEHISFHHLCRPCAKHFSTQHLCATERRRVWKSGHIRAAADEGEASAGERSGEGAQSPASVKTEEKGESAPTLQQNAAPKKKRQADSTDFISSALTRRFGLAGGLAWLGILSFGVISEQVKTRREVFEAEQNTKNVKSAKEVTLPDGVRYTDLVLGGGQTPVRGDLLLINYSGVATTKDGAPISFADTFGKGQRSVAFVFGGRPFAGGLCRGVEEVLSTTKSGGKRRIVVPPELGFGEGDVELQNGVVVPGGSTLEYTVALERVSIAPS